MKQLPIIHTYHTPGAGSDDVESQELIKLWASNWRLFGFQPRMLVEHAADRCSFFKAYDKHVSAFPTINPPAYERACWLRWMACAMACPQDQFICMADYDVFIYSDFIDSRILNYVGRDQLCILQGHVPSIVFGTHKAFWRVIELFRYYALEADDIERGQPHLSDMHLLKKLIVRFPEFIIPFNVVKSIGEDGWRQARVVHYNNWAWRGQGMAEPRHLHIRDARPWPQDALTKALT